MNFSNTFLFAVMFSAVTVINAFDNVVLEVILNNGENNCGEDWGPCCKGHEWDLISHRFYTMVGKQRQLRGNDADEEYTVHSVTNAVDEPRELASNSAYCAKQCAGFASGTCMAAKCKGYRRSVMESVRELFWSTNCENQKSEVNNLFNNMANNNEVGQRCKELLQARDMTCHLNVDC